MASFASVRHHVWRTLGPKEEEEEKVGENNGQLRFHGWRTQAARTKMCPFWKNHKIEKKGLAELG